MGLGMCIFKVVEKKTIERRSREVQDDCSMEETEFTSPYE